MVLILFQTKLVNKAESISGRLSYFNELERINQVRYWLIDWLIDWLIANKPELISWWLSYFNKLEIFNKERYWL